MSSLRCSQSVEGYQVIRNTVVLGKQKAGYSLFPSRNDLKFISPWMMCRMRKKASSGRQASLQFVVHSMPYLEKRFSGAPTFRCERQSGWLIRESWCFEETFPHPKKDIRTTNVISHQWAARWFRERDGYGRRCSNRRRIKTNPASIWSSPASIIAFLSGFSRLYLVFWRHGSQ